MFGIKVPNGVYIALFTAISLFLAANWPDEPWYQLVNAGIGIVLKTLEVNTVPPVDPNRLMSPKPPSKVRRFWID